MPQHILRGALLLLLSEFVFALLGVLIKHLSLSLPNTQIVFFRNALALLVLLPYLRARGSLQLKADKLRFHLLRSATGLTAMYLSFYCLGVLPLGEAILLGQTAPIWIPVIAWFWLGDPLRKSYLFSGVVGLAGVALVVRPDSSTFTPAVMLALFAAFMAACSKVTIRRMSDSESPQAVVLYFTVISTVISAVPAAVQWQSPTLEMWPALIGVGLTAAAGQMLMTKAFMIAPPGRIGAWSYAQVVFAFVLGWLLWDEAVALLSLAGAVLIMIAGLIATGLVAQWWKRLQDAY